MARTHYSSTIKALCEYAEMGRATKAKNSTAERRIDFMARPPMAWKNKGRM
jgi:hypothetical protein